MILRITWCSDLASAGQPASCVVIFRRLLITLVCLCTALTGAVCGPVAAQEKQDAAPANVESVGALPNPRITNNEFSLRLVHLTRAELAELAKSWLKITQPKVKEAASINIALSSAQGPTAEQLLADLDSAVRRRNLLLRKLNLILEEWEAKGAKPDEVAEYRQYAVAIIRKELKVTDPKAVRKFLIDWLTSPDGGVRIGIWLISLIASLLVMIIIAMMLAGLFRRTLFRAQGISGLLRNFLSRAAFWLILAVGIVVILSRFGINMTPVLAAFGGASFIIGFATQSTLSNLASGLLLMINRPFDVGDVVHVAGVSGKVQNVSTVSTTILTSDNQTVVVPNTKVWDSVIMNLEGSNTRHAD